MATALDKEIEMHDPFHTAPFGVLLRHATIALSPFVTSRFMPAPRLRMRHGIGLNEGFDRGLKPASLLQHEMRGQCPLRIISGPQTSIRDGI